MKGELALIAIDALDKLSRYRALTPVESFALEDMVRLQGQSEAGRARLDAWRKGGLLGGLVEPEITRRLAIVERRMSRDVHEQRA